MGYMGPYSLGRRCLAEFIAMTMTIFFGESILANELLPSTKGHGMGWGFATLGFAFAFYASIQMFDSISAHINPAMCLALWITGDMGAADFFAVSLAELAGAMLGAFLVWLHFLPHFKTIPEPAPTDKEDDLIRRRDYLHTNAMQIASYQTAETRTVDRKDVNPIKDVMYYTYHRNSIKAERAQEFLDRYFHKHTKRPEGVLQRRSVQVADLLEQIKLDRLERKLEQQGSFHKEDISEDDVDQHPDMDRPHAVEITEGPIRRTASASGVGVHAERKSAGSAEVRVMPPARSAMSLPPASGRASFLDQAQRLIKRMKGKHVSFNPAVEEKEVSRIDQLYKAAVIADQNAKLSIFATRPAIFSPPLNFLVEVMGTVAIILGALLIKRQKYQLPEPYREVLAVGLIPLQLGFFIWMLIVGLGGPTGYAVNPARDLGPRLAHFLLPIAGKGSSEWRYAWIPFFAPFVGGAIAAVLFKAIDHLYLWE